eukprot:769933-Amphidinium_carterae.1
MPKYRDSSLWASRLDHFTRALENKAARHASTLHAFMQLWAVVSRAQSPLGMEAVVAVRSL